MSQLELNDISLHYSLQGRTVLALDHLNLNINSGEMLAILGPSGSGKSTLLYILGCLLQPTSGSYRLDGVETATMNELELAELRNRHFGFVFQQFHLLPRADLVQNLLLGTRYNRQETRSQQQLISQAKGLLKKMGLETHIKHKPSELSGGQQQRVAIARALMNDPSVILADEPTGNLDSQTSAQVLELLREINKTGKTVIIITHDHEVAKKCDRVISILDGKVVSPPTALAPSAPSSTKKVERIEASTGLVPPRIKEDATTAWQNLLRNKSRSILTMLGVIIGVAAVLSTVTLGTYTKEKILQTYESLGVNKLVVRAYPSWRMQAKDAAGNKFDALSEVNDVIPLRKLFPEIILASSVGRLWTKAVNFGGKTFDKSMVYGVNQEYFSITNREVILGKHFSSYHIKNRSNVCIIGYAIAKRFFTQQSPLGQIIEIDGINNTHFSCRVIGVLGSQTSNNEWFDPNAQILIPNTFLALVGDRWNSKPYELNLKIKPGASIEDLGKKIKTFFRLKYGKTVEVAVDSDALLVAQMKKFLNLFTMLLSGVALISLAVGGIGITNMMLVSISERFKEIGLRKALGARNDEIRNQFLVEAVILCGIAGIIGIIFGICGYHLILFMASKLFTQIKFEFIFEFYSILISFICIVTVGLLSGLIPALRAQKLQVVEALRSE